MNSDQDVFDQSACGKLATQIDWAKTALGPVANWPQSLKTTIGIVLKSSFPMFISWGPERVFIYNDAYSNILGKKHPRAMGQTFFTIWSEIRSDIEPLVLAVDKGESIYLEDLKLILNRHGFDEETYFTFSYSPVQGESTAIAGLFCVVFETTGRLIAEKQLKQNQEQLKVALANGKMGTWSIDLVTNRAITSDEIKDMFGVENFDQDVYQIIRQRMHPDDRDEVERVLAEAIREKKIYRDEYRIVKPDGEVAWILSQGQAIYDLDGTPLTLSGIAVDITDRKINELKLKHAEEEFRSLANTIPQLAWMANQVGQIFWYNQQWYDYTGTSPEEMQGRGWQKVYDPDQLKRMLLGWQNSLATGNLWEDTFQLKSKDGEWRWFLSRARPMRNHEGQIVYWFGTNTDITEQRRVERELKEHKELAEKANQAKTQFLANMSHEIRTPIGAIMGFTDLLKSPTASPEEKSAFMQVIERNSQNLLRLIDDILDLSKVEAGKITLEKNDFSLPDFLADLSSLMTLKATEKGIKFSLYIESLIPDQICTDQLRLRQILTNIVGNAIKFTDVGYVSLTVKNETSFLEFVVTDTGAGIAPENKHKLFKPFAQADPSMTRKFGGSGLGLILSKRLADALGGDLVLAQSDVGLGSTFIVTIDPGAVTGAKMVSNEKLTIPAKSNPVSEDRAGRLSGLRILLVEDSPDNRALVSLYLGNTGARLEIASDGLAGYDEALKSCPDVILMDIQMPKMDGHTATKKLRRCGFSKPIIALTAHAMREERDRCFESGCTDYLTKPIRRDTLVSALERYLQR